MSDNVDNLILEQLRLIRSDLSGVTEKLDDLSMKVDGHTAILIGLGKYIHDIDERVEHIETKFGADT